MQEEFSPVCTHEVLCFSPTAHSYDDHTNKEHVGEWQQDWGLSSMSVTAELRWWGKQGRGDLRHCPSRQMKP